MKKYAKIVTFLKVGAVMASLMAESLDVASENFLKPTKYDKLTSLSKTLRDDPSCQLCTILVKYMMKLDMLVDIGKSNFKFKNSPLEGGNLKIG